MMSSRNNLRRAFPTSAAEPVIISGSLFCESDVKGSRLDLYFAILSNWVLTDESRFLSTQPSAQEQGESFAVPLKIGTAGFS